MVRGRGFEPPRLTAQPPQDCVYTSFTTRARCRGEDLNLHGQYAHTVLNRTRLPIPPPRRACNYTNFTSVCIYNINSKIGGSYSSNEGCEPK